MSQGDALMKRKMENLVQRHQSVGSLHPTRTFCFTEQISPTRHVEESAGQTAVPDNWQEPLTGSYFANGQSHTQNSGQHGGRPGGKSPSLPAIHRVSPAERQATLDQLVRDRVLHALEEQRAAEHARLEACKSQREIEIVKFHQRMKSRTELQMKSNQIILGHSVDQMGLEHLLGATNCSAATRAAAERALHQGDAQRQFVEFNRDRLEQNMLHRQYCLDAHKERQRFRQGLEAHVGTLYSKCKSALLHDIGVEGPEATFATKTVHELRVDKENYHAAKRTLAEEDAAVLLLARDVTEMDDKLWDERRKAKGKATVRTREIEYSLAAPNRRRAQSTEP